MVSRRKLVLNFKRDSEAGADLRATEWTEPIDSVQIVTMILKTRLRILTVTMLVDRCSTTTAPCRSAISGSLFGSFIGMKLYLEAAYIPAAMYSMPKNIAAKTPAISVPEDALIAGNGILRRNCVMAGDVHRFRSVSAAYRVPLHVFRYKIVFVLDRWPWVTHLG